MATELRRLLALAASGELEALAVVSIERGSYRHYGMCDDEHGCTLLGAVVMLERRITEDLRAAEGPVDDGPLFRLMGKGDV